jgi:hypothetical protein
MREKMTKLQLNQETIKRLTDHRSRENNISQYPICNTKFLSCPECNPPRAK